MRSLLPVLRLFPASLTVLLALACAGTEVEVLPPIAEEELEPAPADTAFDVVPSDGSDEEGDGTQDGGADDAPTDEVTDDAPASQPRSGQRRRRSPRPAPVPRTDAGTGETPVEEAPAPAPDPAPKGKPPAPAPAGITQVDASTWQVTQRLVDKWQDNPYSLGNVRESGEGWELIGVRQRNAYHLGMRNSDIVLEVNGRKLNTMPQLLAAYLALKNDKSFEVLFLRSGARKVHHYRIVN